MQDHEEIAGKLEKIHKEIRDKARNNIRVPSFLDWLLGAQLHMRR